MQKEELDQLLKQSWEEPQAVRNLQSVVIQIEEVVRDVGAREVVYDLVASVLFMGERLRELEVRMVGGTPVEENERMLARRRVETQKGKVQRDYTPTEPDYDPTDREWKF